VDDEKRVSVPVGPRNVMDGRGERGATMTDRDGGIGANGNA
jgi:hypothetical protein